MTVRESMTPVFVTGCPRSGTTALVEVLNSHESVVVGMERYKDRYRHVAVEELAGLFRPERFLDFRAGDTNVVPRGQNKWVQMYEQARSKFERGDVALIGDKPRASPSIAELIHRAFPQAQWIFIFRELPYVASSFQARANDPHDRWPLKADYRVALRRWREAFRTAEKLRECVQEESFYCVAYENFFAHDPSQLAALQAYLGVAPSDRQGLFYKDATAGWEERLNAAPSLFSAALEWLEEHRPAELEDRYRRLAEEDVARFAP